MNDIEELNKQMDIELEKSPALKMAFIQIKSLRKVLSSALEQRSKDWEQIQQMQKLLATKTCHCGKTVLASEFIVIYKESGKGVCNWCYMHEYLPYIKEFSRNG